MCCIAYSLCINIMFPSSNRYTNNKKSQIKFIRNVAAPKYSNPIKSYSTPNIVYPLPASHNSKHNLNLVLFLIDKSTQSLTYSFDEEARVKDLVEWIRRKVNIDDIYLKSPNLLIDYFLTLGDRYLKQLIDIRITKLQLKVKRIEVFHEIKLKYIEILKCVGSGGFSKVLIGRLHGIIIAIKVMDKQFISRNAKQSIIENQKSILQIGDGHPFITKLFFTIQTQNYIAIGMEYCPGGELFNLLRKVKKMKQEDARFYFLQTLLAIQHLHANGILYRDLKPENIIIDQVGHIRLADFGLSKNIGRNSTYSFCGSAEYMSPQMLLKKGHSYEVDYYCLGALLYELVTGLPPFYSQNQQQLFNNILNNKLTFPSHAKLSDELKNFLERVLQKDPQKRYQTVEQIMNDRWVAQNLNRQQILAKKLVPPYPTSIFVYNFDDSQYKDQQQSILRTIQRQSEIIDESSRKFGNFYYENLDISQMRFQLLQRKHQNLNFQKFKSYTKNDVSPLTTLSRENSVYSLNPPSSQFQKYCNPKQSNKNIEPHYQHHSNSPSIHYSPKNSRSSEKRGYDSQSHSSQKPLAINFNTIYTTKARFNPSNIFKSSKYLNSIYKSLQKSSDKKTNISHSRQCLVYDLSKSKEKSNSLDKSNSLYKKSIQLNYYGKNYINDLGSKLGSYGKVRKSVRNGEKLTFNYGHYK